jgi:CubicO group peptidase (beta-lactamase class C family)
MVLTVLTACGETEDASVPTEAVTEAPTEAPTVTDERYDGMDTLLEECLTEHGFKGAAYVVCRGEEIYSGGVGKANKKEDIDNDADVVFHIASVTKQFTAAAILQLCEQGKMTLDDTLGMYYPEYAIGADITIHNLLSMQSGIPDFLRAYDADGFETDIFTQAAINGVEEDNSFEDNRNALREWILSQELLFEQGERFSYSNSNYFLLGEIIEKVSGESYFDYLRTRFFEPFGMTTAGFMEDYDNSDATVALGYHRTGYADMLGYDGVAFGCGDIMASPKDLYKWTVALHGGKVLGDEMYQKMITAHVEGDEGYSGYGYGLMIADNGIMNAYFHSGSLPCFLSCVMYLPKLDLYIAVMSNYSSESIMGVVTDISTELIKKIGLLPVITE